MTPVERREERRLLLTEDERLALMEPVLRTACTEARAAGVVLVRDIFEAELPDGPTCMCAMGALNRAEMKGTVKPPPLRVAEYDALEHGWDGTGEQHAQDALKWYALGAKLRRAFNPVPLAQVERPAKRKRSVALRFTQPRRRP